MFNEDQRAYMRGLAATDPARLCWCGWFPLGQCHSCPTDVTAADKLRARCPECHNDPGPEYGRLTHRVGCSRAKRHRPRSAMDERWHLHYFGMTFDERTAAFAIDREIDAMFVDAGGEA